MINLTLTDEEKTNLINETNKLIAESAILILDINNLKDQLSKIDLLSIVINKDNLKMKRLLNKRIDIKNRRLSFILNRIELNKELLGLNKKKKIKKKNKTL